MIARIAALVLNDLAACWKNRSVFLIFFIPAFVFLSLKLTDQTVGTVHASKIGLLEHNVYPAVITNTLAAAPGAFTLCDVSFDEGVRRLKQKELDGMLINNEEQRGGLKLLVLKNNSLGTASILENFSALQKTASGIKSSWITSVVSLQQSGVQIQMLPLWVLLMVLLVSCILVPAQVADEKERKLLLGLLQTPMRESEWMFAKLLSGMILVNCAALLLHLPVQVYPAKIAQYLLFVEAGSFCFISFGIALGFLCRTQASARTWGILLYICLLVPPALADFSSALSNMAVYIPSFRLYGPLRAILLDNSGISAWSCELTFLLMCGAATYLCSYKLIQSRWLM